VPRPENPIQGSGPVAELAGQLRALREAAGLTYRQMAPAAMFSSTVLSEAASGKKLPTWPVVWGFIRACAPEADETWWRQLWETAKQQLADQVENAAAPSPAPSGDNTLGRLPELPRRRLAGLPGDYLSSPEDYLRSKRREEGLPGGLLRSTLNATPDPMTAMVPADFGPMLNEVRRAAGLSFRQLETLSRTMDATNWLPRSTLHELLSGRRRVSFAQARQILRLCRCDDVEIARWDAAYRQVGEYERRAKDALRVLGGTLPMTPSPEAPRRRWQHAAGRDRRSGPYVSPWPMAAFAAVFILLVLVALIVALTTPPTGM